MDNLDRAFVRILIGTWVGVGWAIVAACSHYCAN